MGRIVGCKFWIVMHVQWLVGSLKRPETLCAPWPLLTTTLAWSQFASGPRIESSTSRSSGAALVNRPYCVAQSGASAGESKVVAGEAEGVLWTRRMVTKLVVGGEAKMPCGALEALARRRSPRSFSARPPRLRNGLKSKEGKTKQERSTPGIS